MNTNRGVGVSNITPGVGVGDFHWGTISGVGVRVGMSTRNLGVAVGTGLMMTILDLGTGADTRARGVAVKVGVSSGGVTLVDVGGATGGLGAAPGSPHPASASTSTVSARQMRSEVKVPSRG